MSGEQVAAAETEAQQVEEQEDERDADFDAGFAGEDAPSDKDRPTETPAASAEPPAESPAEAPAPEAAAPAAAPAEPEYVQIPKSEWETVKSRAAKVDEISATLDRRFDQVAGKIGRTMEQKIAEIQAAAPTGAALELSEEDLAELSAEYPDMAQAMRKGMNKALSRLKGTGGADPQALDGRLNSLKQELRQEYVNEAMAAVYPDWQDDVRSETFGDWAKSLPGWNPVINDKESLAKVLADPSSALSQWVKANPGETVSLMVSSNVRDAAKVMRAFYKHRDTPPPAPAAAPTPPAPPAVSVRKAQLAAAVTPRGDGGPPPAPTDDDEFNSGFRDATKARGG